MREVILAINAGSSSIKFSLFSYQAELDILFFGKIESMLDSPCLIIFDKNNKQIYIKNIPSKKSDAGLHEFINWLAHAPIQMTLKAVGHRMVHGGMYFTEPAIVTNDIISKMQQLIPLAPLHQSHNISAIKTIHSILPKLPQVVCFDTSFHLTQEKLATLFAIPQSLTKEGIVRYGFHGISYEYIASAMSDNIEKLKYKRVIVAHLGNGASMCAMYEGKSVATTMGLTALDGLMMGTRCGRIDPGILLYLLQEKCYSVKQLEHLLYKESGLLGVSGISFDMRELLLCDDINANLAIELFCYRAALEFGSLCVALNGCDALIFTGGIGENSAKVRKKIGERLTWLGVSIDNAANMNNSSIISLDNSKMKVCVIPTKEEYMVARHTWSLIHA